MAVSGMPAGWIASPRPWARRARLLVRKLEWLLPCAGSRLCKRTIDICGAGTLLLLLSPLSALVAAAIKVTDGGPVLFWQTRVGRHGREFAFPKFRSMVVDAERLKERLAARNHHGDGITFKMKADPRITRVGRILRRTSVDELPQLWNVLKGDMSLVGPRPAVPKEVARYSVSHRRRLEVAPGLTCIWQVSGRGDIPFERQVQLDVDYIESRSLRVDAELLVRTIAAVVSGRGAY